MFGNSCLRQSTTIQNQEWNGNYQRTSHLKPTLDQCNQACISDPTCKAWKYVTNPGPVCFTSKIVGNNKTDSGNTTSGRIICKEEFSLLWLIVLVIIFVCVTLFVFYMLRCSQK